MKKIIIILSFFSISCSFSQDKNSPNEKNNSFTITANIESLKDSLTVVLTRMDIQNFYGINIDSTFGYIGSNCASDIGLNSATFEIRLHK